MVQLYRDRVSSLDFLSGSPSKTQPQLSPTSTEKVGLPVSQVLTLEFRSAISGKIGRVDLG
jgi:hypothetical protein